MSRGRNGLKMCLNEWTKLYVMRRNWWKHQGYTFHRWQRQEWYKKGEFKKVLKSILGPAHPPVGIKGAILHHEDGTYTYSEKKGDVKDELTYLLDHWIPREETTTPPVHLDTWSIEDLNNTPKFIREWIIPYIQDRDQINDTFMENNVCTWDKFVYDDEKQQHIDRVVSKRVAPGYGGVAQELWIAAPARVRDREKLIVNWILKNGVAPNNLKVKEMIFLPKTDAVDGIVDNSKGLPPWRHITVQSALTTRIFTAVGEYVEEGLPNNLFQHGFQRDKTVQDASLLTRMLIERATEKKEALFMVSKDCLKCYDRIPAWVMNYIYRKLGVPSTVRKLMLDFLSPGEIKVRTAYGWLSTGKRAFGIGQGSVLAIRHIGYYMDLIQEQQQQGLDPIKIVHTQPGGGTTIAGTMFVDDALDVSYTYEGICDRAEKSNIFTGCNGTGGVFGAEKSFMSYYDPSGAHYDAVELNDGLSIPKRVTLVPPKTGFKHLGVMQSTMDLWESSISGIWSKIMKEATRMKKRGVSHNELRYIVNKVWITRIRYRLVLGPSIHAAKQFDILIRNVARNTLRLPYNTPIEQYNDNIYGMGLENCQDDVETYRIQTLLRILNSQYLPVYHVLIEMLDMYQCNAGLIENPLYDPIKPPPKVNTWVPKTQTKNHN